MAKETNKIKRQPMDFEKIYTNHKSDKRHWTFAKKVDSRYSHNNKKDNYVKRWIY